MESIDVTNRVDQEKGAWDQATCFFSQEVFQRNGVVGVGRAPQLRNADFGPRGQNAGDAGLEQPERAQAILRPCQLKSAFVGARSLHRLAPVLVALLVLLVSTLPTLAAESVVFSTDFEAAAVGGIPDDFLVLDGNFAVREEAGNKFLELPGTPLETFAVLFGPNEKEGMAMSARIYGTNKGRRYPAFGVGLNGVAGYRLLVAPAKRSIELYRDTDVLTSVPYQWKPGAWVRFLLEVRKTGESAWTVRGKVWPDGQPEPKEWTVTTTDETEPFSGNAAVWGKPFSGTPIRYDDFKVLKLE